jgi:hypothetical protein
MNAKAKGSLPKRRQRRAEPAIDESQSIDKGREVVAGLAMNAVLADAYSKVLGLEPGQSFEALILETERVQAGSLTGAEAMLTAQSVALNAMFTQLAYHASLMKHVDQVDRFTRLALKAQGQCRTTLETLAVIKNPPTVFARQANIANGPQQVNNNVAIEGAWPRARAHELEPGANKLLEAHGDRLDIGAAATAGNRDSALEAMEIVHGPSNDGRQGPRSKERVPRRKHVAPES